MSAEQGQGKTALDIARGYIARGWYPIPLPHRKKGAVVAGWPDLRITTETAPQYFNNKKQNIGVLTGDASGGLVDIDLDQELARRMAPYFLPDTAAVFGRKTNPASHYLYTVAGGAGSHVSFEDADGKIVEFRSDGNQTVFPGSTHENTGEVIEWSKEGVPTAVTRAALLRACGGLAAATLIAKRWHEHEQDDLCTAVVGAMLRAGAPEAAVENFITAICNARGDDKLHTKRLEKISRFARLLKDGSESRHVPGWPILEKLISNRETLALFRQWLGLDAGEPWSVPHDFLHERTALTFTATDVPPCIGEYAVKWAAAAGFDPTGVISSCVVTAAAALHDSIRLSVQPTTDWYESARLWAALIGAPGLAKTPMIRAGDAPLQQLHREKVTEFTANEFAREADRKKDEDEREPLPALYTNDCTIEKLSEVLAANDGGILYIAEELDSWLGSHDAYRSGGGSRDRGEWLTLFDGGPHQVDRVKRGSFFVSNWGVSFLSATTPAALQKLISKLPNDGLLQRILPFVIAHPSAPDPSVDARIAARHYEKIIRGINRYSHTEGALVALDGEARKVLEAEIARYRELAPACAVISEGLAGHVAKYGSVLARLVLTFHAVDCAAREKPLHPAALSVPLATVSLASQFLRKTFMHARAFYGMLSGSDGALDIARRVGIGLVADGLTTVDRRDLVQKYKVFREADVDKRREAMQLLVDFSWCRVAAGKYQLGYPTRWEINPAIHERFRADGEAWIRRRALVREAITANEPGGEG